MPLLERRTSICGLLSGPTVKIVTLNISSKIEADSYRTTKMNNKQKFIEELEKAYIVLFKTDSRFNFIKGSTTPKELAVKMTDRLSSGTANKEGEGIKLACKACGIKNTYKDLRAFLN